MKNSDVELIQRVLAGEIGEFLSVSANTVKSRLRRAQQRLKKEETMIREALDNFKITPNLTETIMREISRTKPAAPSGGKPLMPWVVATSTLVVVLLMLGFGNSKYLARFQKPYDLDAISEMTVEIVDAPIVSDLESLPGVQTQVGNANALGKRINPEQLNDAPAAVAEAQGNEIVEDYTKWELPKAAKARLGKGTVNDIKFTPDGTLLAVESDIGVWLYDANTGEEIALFTDVGDDNQRLDRSYINILVSATDGYIIPCDGLEGNSDRYPLFSLKEDSLKSILPDLRRRNNVLHFHAENINLTYSGWTMNLPWHGNAGLWNLDDEENKSIVGNLSMLETSMQIAISPDERFLASAYDSRYLGKEYKMPAIQVWDRTIGQRIFTVEETEHKIKTLVFSPDSKTLAYAESSDIVRLWDVENNSLQYMFKAAVPLQKLTFTPDGSFLTSGSPDGVLRFWKVSERGKHSIDEQDFSNVVEHRPDKMLKGHADNSNFIAIDFSPDGKKVASANSDGTIRLWDTDSENQLFSLTQHSESQTALAFNTINQSKMPDATNRTLTSIGLSNSHIFVSVWDIDTGNRLSVDKVDKANRIGSEVAISPDGSLFVTNDNVTRLWDTQTKSVVSTIGGHEYYGFQAKVVFSPDGKLLAASARKDNTVQIWDVPNRKTLCRLKGHTTSVYRLAFSPDNKTVITSGWTYKDVTIRLWDTMTGALLASFPDQGAVAFAPDRNSFVGGSHIYTWNPETIRYDRTVRLEDISKSNPPSALTFSPDGAIVVSGNRNGIIQLRDSTTGKIISEHAGHSNWISVLVFSGDGKTLATSSVDGTILLWDWDEVFKGSIGKDK